MVSAVAVVAGVLGLCAPAMATALCPTGPGTGRQSYTTTGRYQLSLPGQRGSLISVWLRSVCAWGGTIRTWRVILRFTAVTARG